MLVTQFAPVASEQPRPRLHIRNEEDPEILNCVAVFLQEDDCRMYNLLAL